MAQCGRTDNDKYSSFLPSIDTVRYILQSAPEVSESFGELSSTVRIQHYSKSSVLVLYFTFMHVAPPPILDLMGDVIGVVAEPTFTIFTCLSDYADDERVPDLY